MSWEEIDKETPNGGSVGKDIILKTHNKCRKEKILYY